MKEKNPIANDEVLVSDNQNSLNSSRLTKNYTK